MTLPIEVQNLLNDLQESGVDLKDRQTVVNLVGHSTHEGAYLNGIHPDEWEQIIHEDEKPKRKSKKQLDETPETK